MTNDNGLALRTIDDVERVARISTASGICRVQRAEEAAVILLTGRELGLSPMQSLRGIYVVNKTPVLSADLLVAVVRRSGLCASWRVITTTPETCTITTLRVGETEPTSKTWTIADAKRAQLTGKPIWSQYPAQMLRHRCAADLAREVYPDVVLGLYTPDEMDHTDAAPIVEAHEPAAPQLPPHVAAALADEPQGSRAWAEYVAEIADAESCVAAHCLYVALVAAEGETYTREAGDMAEARLRALGYQLDRAEVNAMLAATGQPLARWVDAADEALGNNTGADAVLVAARWWVAQRERIGAALSKPAATMVYMALARSLRTTPDAAGTTKAKRALGAAVEALAPKPPPTGTDSPTSVRGDTATGDATPADAAPSAEAQASIARVGDVHAYLATKHTYTEVERAVVAHGAHVPALAAAAVARLEALGEGGDDGNRERLVAAWVSESASRAQRAERTAAKVQRAA